MKRKGNHCKYEVSLEKFLRQKKVPLIPTNEAKKSIDLNGDPLKSFDLMVLSKGFFLLDVKGKNFGFASAPGNKWENWVLDIDPKALLSWERTFKKNGCKLKTLLVFLYKINFPEDRNQFVDLIKMGRDEYGVVAIEPRKYLKYAKVRSLSPAAISISRKTFRRIVKPISSFIPALEA